ncbi:MAG: hypothetical protein QME61_02150 [Patescibacteria group bacterium]|nr:hypothetical protein [Patescibacteria group bacterium]
MVCGKLRENWLSFKNFPFYYRSDHRSIGTSFPELASSIAAALKGATEIVAANALGSNVCNILLIVGLSALVARRLIVRRSLIDLDAPLLGLSTFLF